MQLLRKDVCGLPEGLWNSQKIIKRRVTHRCTKGQVKFFFLFSFARSHEGRSIGIRGSKQSQDPGHLMGCSISGNAAGISYLTHRELSQETVFTSSSRKIHVQSKNSYQDLHLPELRILVLLFICHRCRETLLLKAGSWGAEKQSWT